MMRREQIDRIHALPFFAGLERPQLDRLIHGGLLQSYPADTHLFDQGEMPDFLHVLLSGRVQLWARTRDGQETTVEVVRPVDNFILAAVLTDSDYLMSARTLETSQLLLLPAESLRAEIVREPKLALTMLGSLAQQYRGLVRQVKDLKLRTSSQRLGCYLLRLAEEHGAGEAAGRATLPYSKRVLAARLGMTPENLSRAFNRLRGYGVTLEGSRVDIADIARLSDFCQPDALIDAVERDLRVVEADGTGDGQDRPAPDPDAPC